MIGEITSPRDVACAKCGAGPGYPCKAKGYQRRAGTVMVNVHLVRQSAARAQAAALRAAAPPGRLVPVQQLTRPPRR